MKYDFETIIDKSGTNACAVDLVGNHPFAPKAPKEGFDEIPLWVADMAFGTYPRIIDRISERLKNPCFGYFYHGDDYYQSIVNWHKSQYGVKDITIDDIFDDNGVLAGVAASLGVLCSKGDSVLINAPCYVCFDLLLRDNGYNAVFSDLIKDEDGIFRMNYADMEEKIINNNIHTAILCSPHNPIGRVWDKEELSKVMEIFEKHNVYVISDEIWSDIILFGNKHVTTQSISEYAKYHTIALYAATKGFNIAGIAGSYRVIYNKWLRDRVEREAAHSHADSSNLFGMEAVLEAYTNGGKEWLCELNKTLEENADYSVNYIKTNFPDLDVTKPEGTYMLFIDCSRYCEKNNISIDEVEKRLWDHGVGVQDGRMFKGICHIRMNIASPKKLLEEAFDRMKNFVFI